MALGWHELLLWRGNEGLLVIGSKEGAALQQDLSENLSQEVSLG